MNDFPMGRKRRLGSVLEDPNKLRGLYRSFTFYLQTKGFRVEPRGFEPLTSAVQRRMHNVVVVR